MKKKALIIGITGQDGAFLSEILLKKGYIVYGISRSLCEKNLWRLKKLKILNKIKLKKINFKETIKLKKILENNKFREIYNFSAQSSVNQSLSDKIQTIEFNSMSLLYWLELLRKYSPKSKYFYSVSPEIFGKINEKNKFFNFNPTNPYGLSKLIGVSIMNFYKNNYNLFCQYGILYSHESIFRGKNFVLPKIITSLKKIKDKRMRFLELGNTNVTRDWGYAKEYCNFIWKSMQKKNPKNIVVYSGNNFNLIQLIQIISKYIGIELKFIKNRNIQKIILKKTDKNILKINKKYIRKNEVDLVFKKNHSFKNFSIYKGKTKIEYIIKSMI